MNRLDNDKYYIAYGSNLNIKDMEKRCPNATIVGSSEIKDYQLLFKGSKTGAYATIEKKEGSIVPIGVWKIDKQDEEALDEYEGYPTLYQKYYMSVKVGQECYQGLVYIMPSENEFGMPSKEYLEVVKTGYRDFKLDNEILNQAVEQAKNQI